MSKLKSVGKWVLIVTLVIAFALFLAVNIISENKPSPLDGKNGDLLANEMLAALNKPAWDTLKFLKWEFMRGHRYLWDKQNNHAVIEWDDYKVILRLDEIDGQAYRNNQVLSSDEKNDAIQKAWSYWCNDSFWMFAPFKVFDPGTTRSVVQTKEYGEALMVEYDAGGVTPGDTYVWLLDDQSVPTGFKMWVSIIPVKGLYMSWENWQTLPGGAKVAVSHQSPLLSFDMKNVQAGASPSLLGYPADIFSF